LRECPRDSPVVSAMVPGRVGVVIARVRRTRSNLVQKAPPPPPPPPPPDEPPLKPEPPELRGALLIADPAWVERLPSWLEKLRALKPKGLAPTYQVGGSR